MDYFKYEKDENGKEFISEYYMRREKRQYIAEGFFVSILAVFTSLSFLAFTRFEKFTVL